MEKRFFLFFFPLILANANFEDGTFISSPRSRGLGTTAVTVPDPFLAPYENPATIGGTPLASHGGHVYFPIFMGSVNPGSLRLHHEFLKQNGTSAESVGAKILSEHSGETLYGQLSEIISLNMGSLQIIQSETAHIHGQAYAPGEKMSDPLGTLPGGPLVDLSFSHVSSLGAGVSMANKEKTFYLGASYHKQIFNIFQEEVSYHQLSSLSERAFLLDSLEIYAAEDLHLGFLWILGKTAMPALGFVCRHCGGRGKPGTKIFQPQAIDMGFSLTKSRGAHGGRIILDVKDSLSSRPMIDKIHFASEIWFWKNELSWPRISLQMGYGRPGFSHGVGFNLGLLELSLGFQPNIFEDRSGITREKVFIAMIAINAMS